MGQGAEWLWKGSLKDIGVGLSGALTGVGTGASPHPELCRTKHTQGDKEHCTNANRRAGCWDSDSASRLHKMPPQGIRAEGTPGACTCDTCLRVSHRLTSQVSVPTFLQQIPLHTLITSSPTIADRLHFCFAKK